MTFRELHGEDPCARLDAKLATAAILQFTFDRQGQEAPGAHLKMAA